MAVRRRLGTTVFDAALDRLIAQYQAGHRLVVSFSGGKDSTVVLNLAILAARLTDRLPVEVVVQDEEIAYPGTYEHIERVMQSPDVDLHWLTMGQAIHNLFNRADPYWWVFDPDVDAATWVRPKPMWAEDTDERDITRMTTAARFPAPHGKDTMAVIGLRVAESRGRLYGIFSSGGYLTKPNAAGVVGCRPIYDWSDADVWRAIRENAWPYNPAYDTLLRHGVSRARLRIGPPTMTLAGADHLVIAARAWPQWFERVCVRCPGVRAAAMFGRKAAQPIRYAGESWQQCFTRTCIRDAPEWIRVRAVEYSNLMVSTHAHHSTAPLPETQPCHHCESNQGSWRTLTLALYNGDPFSLKCHSLPYVEPSQFRPHKGTWFKATDQTAGKARMGNL